MRSYYADEDLRGYEELDGERWATRHVEVRERDGAAVAAASLAEMIAAREGGGISAVVLYERQYGVVPEPPFPEVAAADEPPMEPITAEEFEALWQRGRQAYADQLK
jgi:hypothetical protein